MILQRLYELAERERLLDDPAFEELPVPWIVKIGRDGEYVGIEQRRGVITMPAKTKDGPPKTKPDKGEVLNSPRAHGNTANPGFARYFVDTLARVLPISDEAKSVKSRDTFWQQIEEAAVATGDLALAAVLGFGRKLVTDVGLGERIKSELAAAKPVPGDRCTFAWHPDLGQTVLEREAVRAWFRGRYSSLLDERQESGLHGVCQITGELGPLPASHPGKLTGIPGGLAAGVSLISYDKAAFESYGLEGAANAGIGYRAADGYLRALAALTNQRLPKRPRSSLRVGSLVFLFWTREPTGNDDVMQLEQPVPEEVAHLMASVERGELSHTADENQFYCLTLSANSARAIVRDYLESPLSNVQLNLGRWFRDLQIVDDGFEQQGRIQSCFPLWMLAGATARAMEEIAPDCFSRLFQAALQNRSLPDSILAACLRRIRVDSGSQRLRAPRMALIKLCLNRTYCKGAQQMTEALTLNSAAGTAYVCGRLLAFLARCQSPGDFGTGAQILGRYFGSASMSPRSVFPTLLRLNRHHLSKIRDEKQGFAFNLEAELDELLLPLKRDSGTPDFPAVLTLADQGRFALGFYHQRADYRVRNAERKLKEGES